jgi:hypothetical protein
MMSAWGNRLLFIYHNNKSDARTTCDTIILGLFDLCHLLPPRPLVPFNSIILISEEDKFQNKDFFSACMDTN